MTIKNIFQSKKSLEKERKKFDKNPLELTQKPRLADRVWY